MAILLSAFVGLVVGFFVAVIFNKDSSPYNQPGYTPLADLEMARIRENSMQRVQDYWNNPVVEYMKAKDGKR